MSEVELTKMSSRGQIVIPLDIRSEMDLNEGDSFAVTGNKDTLLLKKIKTPSKEEILSEWEKLNKKGRKQVKKLGIKEKDVSKIIHKRKGINE